MTIIVRTAIDAQNQIFCSPNRRGNKGTVSRAFSGKADEVVWPVAEAKARVSEVIENANAAPQTITRSGKPVAMIVGIEEWRRKTERKGNLADFFLSSPLRGSGIDLERIRDEPRDIGL